MSRQKREPYRTEAQKRHARDSDAAADHVLDQVALVHRPEAERIVERNWLKPYGVPANACPQTAALIVALAFGRLDELPSLRKTIYEGLRDGQFADEAGFRRAESRLAARTKRSTVRQAISRARNRLK